MFERFPIAQAPNESQTEDDLIWPVLHLLGWNASLRQQNLSTQGREDVPDGLLFSDQAAKDRANAFAEEWRRYELGLAVVESKRWLQPLDRRSGSRAAEGVAPSTQMLRYLRRVDDLTSGALRWGILTNGARWRLYYQGARSVSEQFSEIELAAALDLPGHNDGFFTLSDPERRRALKLFILFFRRHAFLPDAADSRTLHQRALDEGRFHQERVAANLSDLVFDRVFPELAGAIAPFFRSIATEGRLRALYDFENRRVFFPDVHASFKFCVFVASRKRLSEPAHGSYYLNNILELTEPERRFPLTAEEFAAVNPNTGTAPIFRTRRDAELTNAIYRRLPVLVDRSTGKERKTWPVKYATMFHMTNDSGRFRTREKLEEREGAWPIGGNRFESASGTWVPLYEGKMVQAFDHRAARIVVNPENLHRPASPLPATLEQHCDPDWLPTPQYWIEESQVSGVQPGPAIGNRQSAVAETTSLPQSVDADRVPRSLNSHWWIGWKDVTAPTNIRTVIAAAIPYSGVGNTFPILLSDGTRDAFVSAAPLMLANLNAVPLDYVARQKVQGKHLNWYIVEQLPVVPPERYEVVRFGPKTATEVVREAVLELTYTAHGMAPFARDLGYVEETGATRPPFHWDERRRLRLRAKLDAVYFHLYGVTDRDDIRYVYSTFPIVERQETAACGGYRSRDMCLAYLNALAAGRPDAEPDA